MVTGQKTRRMLHMAGETTSRVITDEGYLLCDSIISREGVFPFRSNELDGPDENSNIEFVYISPDVLFNPKTIADVSILPTTNGHPGPDVGPDNYHELATGHVMGGTVGRMGPGNSLGCKLLITRPDAIQGIQNHMAEEISLGFYADVQPDNGVFEGQAYTKRFVAPLNVNHVAVVPKGRAGSQVRINNAMPDFTTVAAPAVKALVAMKVKRLNMQEVGSDDIEGVIWGDPQKELAARDLSARAGEQKTLRDMGERPRRTGQGQQQWDAALNSNTQRYERKIRQSVKTEARKAQSRNLISIALGTGLAAVLADHIWDAAMAKIRPENIDTVSRFSGRADMAVGGPYARNFFVPFDPLRRMAQVFASVFGDPVTKNMVHKRATMLTESAMKRSPSVMAPNDIGDYAMRPDVQAQLGDIFFNRPDLAATELKAQNTKLWNDLYQKYLKQEEDAVKSYIQYEIAAVGGLAVLSMGGAVYLGSKLDELKAKVKAFLNSKPVEAADDRTDMATVTPKQASAAQLEKTKNKMKSIFTRKKKGYPKGFLHGTIGGGILGGGLVYGVSRGLGGIFGGEPEEEGIYARQPQYYQ